MGFATDVFGFPSGGAYVAQLKRAPLTWVERVFKVRTFQEQEDDRHEVGEMKRCLVSSEGLRMASTRLLQQQQQGPNAYPRCCVIAGSFRTYSLIEGFHLSLKRVLGLLSRACSWPCLQR
jgi:hypothetical protein